MHFGRKGPAADARLWTVMASRFRIKTLLNIKKMYQLLMNIKNMDQLLVLRQKQKE